MQFEELQNELTNIAFFSNLSSELQNHVAQIFHSISEEKRIPEGMVLFKAGAEGTDVGYILIDGEITIGKEGYPEFQGFAPDLIGEMELFNPAKQRTATVKSGTELRVLQFRWSSFTSALSKRVSDSDRRAVKDAIESHAWDHFTSG